MQHLNVSGFHIGYMIEDGKVYVQADDVARYFGYKSTGKRVNALYSDHGIGTITKYIKYDGEGKQRFWMDKHGVKEFVHKSKKDRVIVSAKVLDLVNTMQWGTNKVAQVDELSGVRLPQWIEFPREDIVKSSEGRRPMLKNKSKIVEAKVVGSKVRVTFESGRKKEIDKDSYIKREDTLREGEVCCISGRAFQPEDLVYTFRKQVKGHGTYMFLMDSVEGCEQDGVWKKIVKWFKR